MRKVALWTLTVVLTLVTTNVHAQNLSQSSRAFVPNPGVLSMGDAAVALPNSTSAHFYNPAFALQSSEGFQVDGAALRVSGSTNVGEHWAFFRDEIQPALNEGFDNLSDAHQDEFADQARELGRTRTVVGTDFFLPSVSYRFGDIAIKGGFYGHSRARYHTHNAGADVPFIEGRAHADLIGVASIASRLAFLGLSDLTIGATLKHTHRYFTGKSKPADAFREEEDLYLQQASATGVDIGALYELNLPLPGQAFLGGAIYDFTLDNFDYEFKSNLTNRSETLESVVQKEVQKANERYRLSPSYRLGASYILAQTGIGTASFTIDWLRFETPYEHQSAWTNLHVGTELQITPAIAFRGGLNQGYPTAGAKLDLGILAIEYAYFGREEGRQAGQLPRWNHTAQISVGL